MTKSNSEKETSRCPHAKKDHHLTLVRRCKLTESIDHTAGGVGCSIQLCETEEYKNCPLIKDLVNRDSINMGEI